METKTKDCTELHQESIQKQIPKWGPEIKDRKWDPINPEIKDRKCDLVVKNRKLGPVVGREIDEPPYTEPKYKTDQEGWEEYLEIIKNNMPDDFNDLGSRGKIKLEQHCKMGNLPLLQYIFKKYEIGYYYNYLNMLFIISCEHGHLEMAKWLYSVHKHTDKKKVSESKEKLYESNKNVWTHTPMTYESHIEYVRSYHSLDINRAFVCASMDHQIEVTEWLLSIKPRMPDIKKLLLTHEKKIDYYSLYTSYYPEDLTYAEFMKSQHP